MVLLIEQHCLHSVENYTRLITSRQNWTAAPACRLVSSRGVDCGAVKLNQKNGGALHSRWKQETLWREYFRSPSDWWDNRQDKKSIGTPDFRHKVTEEGIWLDNFCKPAWVDEQLALLDTRRAALTVLHTPDQATVPKCREDITVYTVRELCEQGHLIEAVDALSILVQTGTSDSVKLLSVVLKNCMAQKNLVQGQRVHDLVVRLGYVSNTFLANHILRMYASQGKLQETMEVFSSVDQPDAFMWSSVISACARNGDPKQAVHLYQQMRRSDVKPDSHVYVAALQACGAAADLTAGKQVHSDVVKSGLPINRFVGNSLVDMYAKCGKLDDALNVFEKLATKDVVTWTSIIAGYAEYGQPKEAIQLYQQMSSSGVEPDGHTIVAGLKACAGAADLDFGRQIHGEVLESGAPPNLFVCNSLMDMYAKCGELEAALRLFDSLATRDVVTWTALIAGYTQHGFVENALTLYARMEQEGLVLANDVTFACLLNACATVGALQQGKQLHTQILERGLLEGNVLVGSSLVHMYAKCGEVEEAQRVFDNLSTRNVVTWNALITGYAEHGLGQDALALYAIMEKEGIEAGSITFACLLKACAKAAALQQGKQLHSQILEKGLLEEQDILVGNCLVEMYAKCGKLEDARKAFDSLPRKDVVTWNVMINGYGQCSEGHKAIECFHEMLQAGVRPTEVTFTCLLVACSHEGLVDEGRLYFDAMVEVYGIVPNCDHYNCMVDLLGRAGHLDEAEHIMSSLYTNDIGLTSLLNSCKSHGDVDRGARCFETLVRINPQHAGAYVLMANAYSDVGRWEDVDRVERLRNLAGASKKPAMAGIEVNKQVHTFTVGERRDDISSKAESLNVRLVNEGGHTPHTEQVLKPLPEREKESDLCGHAEKLALAYGLLNTPDGTPLLVTKNLRMCMDCHSSTTIMSRVENREIVVRDAHRVHRFEGGSCSCGGRP